MPVTSRQGDRVCCMGYKGAARLDWVFMTRGDSLWVKLNESRGTRERLAEFNLDFALCKEALASTVYGSTTEAMPGFTDEGGFVSPRIERVRATFISRRALNSGGGSRVYLVGQADDILLGFENNES